MKNNLYYQDEYIAETFRFSMLARLMKYAARHKKDFWLCVFAELLLSSVSLLPGILYSVIVKYAFPAGGGYEENYMLITLLCLGGLFVVSAGLSIGYYFETRLPLRFGRLICTEIRSDVFDHLMTLSFRYFDTHSTGKILVRVTNYVDELASLFSDLFYVMLYFLSVILVSMIWALSLDWRVGGAVLIGMIPLFCVMLLLAKSIHRRAGVDHNKSANYTAFVAENIGGAEVIRSYNRAQLNGKIAGDLFRDYTKAFMKTTHVREAFFPFAHGFTSAVVTLLVYGVSLAIILTGWGGGIGLNTVVGIASVLGEAAGSLGSLCDNISSLSTLTTNIERIFDTIDTPADICDGEDAEELKDCKGEVKFDHVDFSYIEGVSVLKDFSLSAAAGETVALVGATGSGKTTIVNLLSRFYDVTGGKIELDGKDIRKYTVQSLRESVGVMMQDTYIFSGTVMENIRFAKPSATDEECIAAARAACADDFIRRLPEGYETKISEGIALSGGERQLLSFARLLLADPKVVILDEATSHIDTQTERLVQKSLKTLLEGRTSFVIAHRLSTIRGADKIVFIKDGAIAESGTHEELLSLNGNYARLFRAAVK